MVAKTSAIGAVTAHLIHGLRNPLSGLQSFVAKRNARDPERSDTEWQAAISTAQRMQSLVNRVVQVLQEQHCTAEYELSIDELVSLLEAKVRPSAQEAQVRWERSVSADATLANRDANLVLLVLENLVQNAIQATPAGKTVRLDIEARLDEIVCTVSDEGSGLPPTVQENLFTPCRSTKDGGSGIGLAISKQLANHLAARLELQRTSPHGSTFAFLLPARLFDQTALDHSAKVASPTHA
jgi:signal transduction histidine kinase